jgi:hypothetical protein
MAEGNEGADISIFASPLESSLESIQFFHPFAHFSLLSHLWKPRMPGKPGMPRKLGTPGKGEAHEGKAMHPLIFNIVFLFLAYYFFI